MNEDHNSAANAVSKGKCSKYFYSVSTKIVLACSYRKESLPHCLLFEHIAEIHPRSRHIFFVNM